MPRRISSDGFSKRIEVIGSEGSSSDLIVKQWTESDSLVYNGSHSTGQQSGPMVRATNLKLKTGDRREVS
jgi:hypothetical protein